MRSTTVEIPFKRKSLRISLFVWVLQLVVSISAVTAMIVAPDLLAHNIPVAVFCSFTSILHLRILSILWNKYRKAANDINDTGLFAWVIDGQGVTDNAALVSLGTIQWSEIDNFQIKKTSKFDVIAVQLRDSANFTRKFVWWKRLHLKTNAFSYKTPVILADHLVDKALPELKELLDEHLSKQASNRNAIH